MTIYTWAKGSLPKNIGSWMHGNGHVQILLRGAGDNTPHRLKLMKNRKLSRAISDLGWRSFRTMLEAKE